ncbi:13557_t:CDS:1 [Funneliformis mosseae]|uniref:13557_t:CDS:1 n=1 Tax=Funneliformis mosseae TaxID=27381 RepID=A0A9N9DMF9_FUNMO|nr:13557_t:CDS:1 [Funneliformis mosseae]
MSSISQILTNKCLWFFIAFVIVSDLLYTVYFNFDEEDLKFLDTFEQNRTNIRQRPEDGFVLDTDRVMQECNMKTRSVESCLKYLDLKEDDYTITFPLSSKNSIIPPQCKENEPPMLFHVFWRGMITDKLALQIKSFLYTQPLTCSKLNVWLQDSDTDINLNPFAGNLYKRFSPRNVEFRRWDTDEQLNSDDLYKGWKEIMEKHSSVAFSDLVRFVVLNRYGGMYMDGDVLFLRDMRPLYHSGLDFSYKWSFKTEYNTAVLRLHANGTTSRKIISQAMLNKMNFHPFQIKNYLMVNASISSDSPLAKSIYNSQLYMYSVPLFDPLWLKNDNKQKNILKPNLRGMDDVWDPNLIPNEFPEIENLSSYSPLELRNADEFFRGAFAYHWHNNWSTDLNPNCWMGVMQTAYDSFLNGTQTNIYGEYVKY